MEAPPVVPKTRRLAFLVWSRWEFRSPTFVGGWNQAQAHAQFVANVVDYGMNVQAALEQPRFTKGTFEGCDVQMENTIPQSVRDELTKRGHQIELLEPFSFTVGQGEAVVRDTRRDVNFAGADPRNPHQQFSSARPTYIP